MAWQISKLPFLLGDLLLLVLSGLLLVNVPHPLTAKMAALLVLCVGMAACLGILPFVLEFRANFRKALNDDLADTAAQIAELKTLTGELELLKGNLASIQEQTARAAAASREVGDKLSSEAKAFTEFLKRTDEKERGFLRLEAEKLRRQEGTWLKGYVGILDHVYALYQGGRRSGQKNLIEQLGAFQRACRESARLVGLVPYEVARGDRFDKTIHQLMDPKADQDIAAIVDHTIAVGYRFQGQLIRPAVVAVTSPAQEPTAPASGQLSLPVPPTDAEPDAERE